jgi:uncharacterized protein
MLLQIGALQFALAPLNAHEIDRQAKADYVDKKIISRPPVYEYMGDGEDTITVRGRLFPFKTGGLGAVELAYTIMESGAPQMVVRGDGKVYGWFVIVSINERAEYLAPDGVGQLIGVEVELKRADAPTAAGYFASLFGMVP